MLSTHEEADIIILRHTIDFTTTHSRSIVRGDDIDILVLVASHATLTSSCDTTALFFKISKRIPYKMLVVNIGNCLWQR